MTRRRCKRAGILLWTTILTAVAVLAIWEPGMGTWPRGTARWVRHIAEPYQMIAVLGDSVASGAHDHEWHIRQFSSTLNRAFMSSRYGASVVGRCGPCEGAVRHRARRLLVCSRAVYEVPTLNWELLCLV
jgi:hypothetical protein